MSGKETSMTNLPRGPMWRAQMSYKFDGELHESLETEASWMLMDQQGKFWSYGPVQAPRPMAPEELERCEPHFEVAPGVFMPWSEIKQVVNEAKGL